MKTIDIPILILAGGFGTRLKSVVHDVPKPLAPIHGIPFMEILLDQWYKNGFRNFYFLLHYQSEMMIQFIESYQQNKKDSVVMNWIVEEVPLGTGGAIANAVKNSNIKGDFIVANADTYLGKSTLSELVGRKAPAIVAVEVNDTSRYGTLHIENQKLVGFQEKELSKSSGHINAGSYLLSSDYFVDWDSKPFSMEVDLFPRLIETNGIDVVTVDTYFIDIGIPDDYSRFSKWIESGKKTVL